MIDIKTPHGFKKCTKCLKSKAKHLYRKDGSKKDGLYPSCTECYRKRVGSNEMNRKLKIDSSGYPSIDGHRVHRYKMEAFLGRKLYSYEHVHHKNSNRKDYRISNLEVLSASEHHKLHYDSLEIKPHEIQKKVLHFNCVICDKKFQSVAVRSKYCSPHCVYLSRVEYFNKWYAKNKSKSKTTSS